jgi:hypothetical protein
MRLIAALKLMPWSRAFDESIQPPKGKALVTLRDAASYIMELPGRSGNRGEMSGSAVIRCRIE